MVSHWLTRRQSTWLGDGIALGCPLGMVSHWLTRRQSTWLGDGISLGCPLGTPDGVTLG